MAEGGFGTGPGDDMRWDNRWDLGLQFRWNLTQLVTAADRQRALCARTEQAHLAYEDLRRKLTAGVHESREVIVSGRDQIRLGQEQIDQARQAYNLSEKRQRNDELPEYAPGLRQGPDTPAGAPGQCQRPVQRRPLSGGMLPDKIRRRPLLWPGSHAHSTPDRRRFTPRAEAHLYG